MFTVLDKEGSDESLRQTPLQQTSQSYSCAWASADWRVFTKDRERERDAYPGPPDVVDRSPNTSAGAHEPMTVVDRASGSFSWECHPTHDRTWEKSSFI